MNKAGRKIIIAAGAVYILAFLAFLGWSYFTVPPIRIAALKTDWIIGNTLVLFARALIPLHLSAIVFCFSLFFRGAAGSGKREFFACLRFMVLTFLVLVLLYSVLLEAGLPLGLRLREDAVENIRRADELRMKARDASSRGQFREARRYLQYALVIFPEDEELRHEVDAADRAGKADTAAGAQPAPADTSPLLLNMSFEEFLSRARNAFGREDFISAEYYANFALRLNQEHPEPKRIIAEARQKLTENLPGSETRADMDFFRRKQAGAEMLLADDAALSYRYLQTLHAERPDDPDVRHYLRLAYTELQKASFLFSEIPPDLLAKANPARNGIVFINANSETGTEFLYIGQIAAGAAAYYAFEIECIKIAPDGSVVFHFGAPYGKFADGTLLMRCVDSGSDAEYKPEYYAGRREGAPANQLALSAGAREILSISAGGADYANLPLLALWQTAGAAALLGVNPDPVYMAFFSRISLPFSFFVLSFLAAAYGMRYRSRYAAFPPLPYFFFLPFLPLIMTLVFHVYLYAFSAAQGFFLTAFGFSVSLGVFCALQGLLLFTAFLVFARQFRQ